uniref:FYVE-type domain-containing protein n=1 Tax=Kalanchoe fedtschenkoi TaxID=63787 RepID=A0A7N0SWZ1_KALFE
MSDRMASQLGRTGTAERDIELAITALKKGTYLLKYGRRGKPKFCPFRLSNDESILIWFSGKEEKYLRLSNVSRIISGQRTPIFQRHPWPEKEYQSFSLISNDGSLDVICKDKEEAEVWFSGLKTLISRSNIRKSGSDSRSDGISSEATSPRRHTRQSSPLHPIFDSADCLQKDRKDHFFLHNVLGSPSSNGLDKTFSDAPPKSFFPSESESGSTHSASSGGSNGMNGHNKVMGVDAFRVSFSSALSSSSQGSGRGDGDFLGDVYMWGESFWDDTKADHVLPQAVESAVVLDVQSVACGGRYAALVTKRGEIFSWGEESGGRLGHGVDSKVLHPKLIDSLCQTNVELVACGEYHTCGVSLSGDLYTWGDGTHNYGLLGHENQVSHWVPKRVTGPLDGVRVSHISCGPWHTAVVTSSGQLFTFGDGTFGVLGHGDRISVRQPREVESLKGFRTMQAACGVWHTAAVVEVMTGNSDSSNSSSGQLFTWGDEDKARLGHGDKEPKLVPTCVASLAETSFHQVTCGHSLTVALSNAGQVYTMGSSVYGQLGNPQASGKHPTLVEGNLSKVFVEEIACGAYHVAVLTSRAEVYTWGKGANGRLGHGNTDDRNSPTLVQALKDKQAKSISCGTNFTAAICLHKRISYLDHSICSGCRSPFNLKKKRHNCYHCGLFFCHACSDKKAHKASMAPNPKKPYRVCNSCFVKLSKSAGSNTSSHEPLSRRESKYQGTVEPLQKAKKHDLPPHYGHGRFALMESMTVVDYKQSTKTRR